MSTMRISPLAERSGVPGFRGSGVPATTLRYYEGAELLPAERTPAGYRKYGEAALERLAFIGAAKQLGLPLDDLEVRAPADGAALLTDLFGPAV